MALVHDWLITLGGADRVLLALHELFPQAPVYVALVDRERLPAAFSRLVVHPSWLQRLPGAIPHRWLVPLMPAAFPGFRLAGYDLIVSSSHACAKGIRVPSGAVHICYCHTPMRYAWEMTDEYVRALPAAMRPAARAMLVRLRRWDRNSAQRVDHFVANSRFVAGRIGRYYDRDATVIYPPVDTEFFTPGWVPDGTGVDTAKVPDTGDYFLVVSRLVSYKRVDLAVEAFNQLGLPLVVAGDGPERRRLQAIARPNVRFVGSVSDEQLRDFYRGCVALIFPGVEDFGIVPVEAQACGRPVIAFGGGGVLESVAPGRTGVLFHRQTTDALADAVRSFDPGRFDPGAIRTHAEQFSRARFRQEMMDVISRAMG